MRRYSTLSGWLVLLLAGLLARPAAGQARRTVQGLQAWPEVQAELALKRGDYLLLAFRGQRDVELDYSGDSRSLGFDERRVTLAYEHFWNEHWSGGSTLRLQGLGNQRLVVVPEVLLRHRSGLGPFSFGQRLGVERTFPNTAGYTGATGPNGETWVQLRVDLEKSWPLGSISLRPRLSYEAATHLRLQKAELDEDERTIQFTNLRAEVGCRLGNAFDLTPWFAYQTIYVITLPQFNGSGQQVSGGNLNQVTPVVGLDLRLTLYQGKTAFERQQLPTQH